MELVEVKTAKNSSRSTIDFDGENGREGSDFEDIIYDINEKNISGSESYSNVPTNLPKWAEKTLSSAGLDIGNPAYPRRTRFAFLRAGIALS